MEYIRLCNRHGGEGDGVGVGVSKGQRGGEGGSRVKRLERGRGKPRPVVKRRCRLQSLNQFRSQKSEEEEAREKSP